MAGVPAKQHVIRKKTGGTVVRPFRVGVAIALRRAAISLQEPRQKQGQRRLLKNKYPLGVKCRVRDDVNIDDIGVTDAPYTMGVGVGAGPEAMKTVIQSDTAVLRCRREFMSRWIGVEAKRGTSRRKI
jgi:hypothetical protein